MIKINESAAQIAKIQQEMQDLVSLLKDTLGLAESALTSSKKLSRAAEDLRNLNALRPDAEAAPSVQMKQN